MSQLKNFRERYNSSAIIVLPIDLRSTDVDDLRKQIENLQRYKSSEDAKIVIAGQNNDNDPQTLKNIEAIQNFVERQQEGHQNLYFAELPTIEKIQDGPQVYEWTKEVSKKNFQVEEVAAVEPISEPPAKKSILPNIFRGKKAADAITPQPQAAQPTAKGNRPDWTKENTTVTINGMEPFLKQIEKNGVLINSIIDGSNIVQTQRPNIADVSHQTVRAKMISGATLTIKVEPSEDAGRKITLQMAHKQETVADSNKELASVVSGMMDRCKKVARHVRDLDDPSNPTKDISIDTSECKGGTRVVIDRYLTKANCGEQLASNKDAQQTNPKK